MISAAAAILLEQATAPPPVQPPPVIRPVPGPPAPPPPPRKLSRARPLAEISSLIRERDYPPAAMRANVQGTVGYRLAVDPNGRVTACTVTRPSGSAALDSATCRILQSRARFEPARDALGRPTSDSFAGRIAWRINRRLNQPFAPLMMIEEMRADAAGALTCRSSFNAEPLTPRTCPGGANATALAALASAQRKPLALSVVMKLTPEGSGPGAAEPADGANRGDLFRASDAVLTIRGDGSIAECRVVRNEWIGGGNKGVPPSPCLDWYPEMRLYRPAAEGTAIRTVKVTVRGYAAH
jgi:TonB family protein